MKLLLIVLFIALPSVIFAQSNYHQGYVLKNNGDTLKGFINYREWEQNPKSIDFKINKDDNKALHFDPKIIKGFQVSGMETYISYTGMISMNPTSFSDIPETLDTTKKLDTVFLKQIITGKHLTLCAYNDDIKHRFFIAETSGAPVELEYYQYYNNDHQIATSAIYKGQLLLYADQFNHGNNKLMNRIEQLHYRQTSLESLIYEINNNNPIVKKKSSRLFVGFAINRTITEVHNIDYSGVTQNYTTIAPKINLGIDIFDNPNVQRLVFRAELSFSYVDPHYNSPVTDGGNNNNGVYSFNQFTTSLTPQVLFNVYNKDAFKLYMGAGVAFNFSAYTNKLTIPNAINSQGAYKLNPFWFSAPLQAGVALNKKIEIHITRIGGAPFTSYTNGFHASNKTLSLGVKYLIGPL